MSFIEIPDSTWVGFEPTSSCSGSNRLIQLASDQVIGDAGFEPAASAPQTQRSGQAELIPE